MLRYVQEASAQSCSPACTFSDQPKVDSSNIINTVDGSYGNQEYPACNGIAPVNLFFHSDYNVKQDAISLRDATCGLMATTTKR